MDHESCIGFSSQNFPFYPQNYFQLGYLWVCPFFLTQLPHLKYWWLLDHSVYLGMDYIDNYIKGNEVKNFCWWQLKWKENNERWDQVEMKVFFRPSNFSLGPVDRFIKKASDFLWGKLPFFPFNVTNAIKSSQIPSLSPFTEKLIEKSSFICPVFSSWCRCGGDNQISTEFQIKCDSQVNNSRWFTCTSQHSEREGGRWVFINAPATTKLKDIFRSSRLGQLESRKRRWSENVNYPFPSHIFQQKIMFIQKNVAHLSSPILTGNGPTRRESSSFSSSCKSNSCKFILMRDQLPSIEQRISKQDTQESNKGVLGWAKTFTFNHSFRVANN